MNGLRLGIMVGDRLDEVRELRRRAGRGYLRNVDAGLRFDGTERIGGSTTFVFRVSLGHAARFHRQGNSDIVVKSYRLLIQADDRLLGRPRLFIDLQHVFHSFDVFLVEFGDAPHFFSATAATRGVVTRSGSSPALPWGPVCA